MAVAPPAPPTIVLAQTVYATIPGPLTDDDLRLKVALVNMAGQLHGWDLTERSATVARYGWRALVVDHPCDELKTRYFNDPRGPRNPLNGQLPLALRLITPVILHLADIETGTRPPIDWYRWIR